MATDNTGKDVGQFFKGLGEGIVSIVGGFGASLQSGANYNNAVANQINANASTSAERLRVQEESKKAEQRLILFVFIVISVIPLVGLALIKK